MEAKLDTAEDVTQYLQRHERKEILRFVTVGSVDDGKSTLIGRLLHDTNGIYEDQLSAVRRASNMAGAEIDFSLFTDGLMAEREQGITIDVAYRYFSTEKRKFIIADTPGHVQYTRNMATGASTASVALILIDARLGILPQSRRHAYIASLLGIPHLTVCVNKMDLRGWDRGIYETIRKEFAAFAAKLDFQSITYIPISALKGDNLVHRSANLPFYDGPTLLEHLENVPVGADRNLSDFRFPVQLVLRPSHDYRGYAAQVASGVVKPGDAVMVLPSRKTSRIVGIDADGKPIDEAFAPMSVALRLADEIDVSRGDMLVHPTNVPRVETKFDATLVWMHERPLDPGKSYLLKHTTQTVRADIVDVGFKLDLETLGETPLKAGTGLALNDIGRVTVRAHRPLFIDAYRKNRATGAFVVIDSLTNDTVAAGMILESNASDRATITVTGEHSQISTRERRERLGHGAAVVVLGGAPRESQRAAAFAAERLLFDRSCISSVVDRVDAAAALVHAGMVAICVTGAPEEGARARLTDGLGEARVVAVDVTSDDAEKAAAAIVAAIEARGIL